MSLLLTDLGRPEPWMAQARCAKNDVCPDIFFGDKGGRGATSLARKVCDDCPVLAACAAWAIADPSQHGFCGGMSEDDRRRARRRLQREAARARTTPAATRAAHDGNEEAEHG